MVWTLHPIRHDETWYSWGSSCVRVFSDQSEPTDHCSLLFIHGRWGCGRLWSNLIQLLASQFSCMGVDLPAHGKSFSVQNRRGLSLTENSKLVEELISHEKGASASRVVIIGHDIGGVIGQICAMELPERVAGLVLINSASLTQNLYPFGMRFFGWTLRLELRQMLAETGGKAESFRKYFHEPLENRLSRKALNQSFLALEETWPRHYERLCWKTQLQCLSQPALLLWGERDRVNPPENGMELLRLLPNASYYQDPDCAHWPSLENPEWVADKIREFIFKIEAHSASHPMEK